MRAGWLIACLVASCYRDSTPAQPPPPPPPPQRTAPLEVTPPRASSELYALDEALADVLSGPLVHIGTGEWFGLYRINACAYRNARVVVVNIYCTPKEMSSFGLVVLSPTRGRVYIYAEAKAPISKLRRPDYFTFKGESEPPRVDGKLRALDLAFTYAQLRTWDERRYYRNIPGCFGGIEIKRPIDGCMQELASHKERWAARNKQFLTDPPDEWYRIVHDLRGRAQTEGKAVPHPGG
jgi:hypothetical protein